MKQPNEYWLKYMLLFSGLSSERIGESACMYDMTKPSTSYLRELDIKLRETRPPRLDLGNNPTRVWVRRQRVMSLATGQKYAIQARDLLGDTKVRPVIEALILSDADIGDVSKHTLDITGNKICKKTLNMYRHYFWNRELLSSGEWFSYLDDHPNGKLLSQCYKQGLEYALWRLGFRVELSQQEVIRGVFHESAMRFFETTTQENNRDTALTAKLWAENIFKATEELNKTGDEVRQVLDELRNVAIRLGKRDISSIDDLK